MTVAKQEVNGEPTDANLMQEMVSDLKQQLRERIKRAKVAPEGNSASSGGSFDMNRMFENLMAMKMIDMMPRMFDSQQQQPQAPPEKSTFEQMKEVAIIKAMNGDKSGLEDFIKYAELMSTKKDPELDRLREDFKEQKNMSQAERDKLIEQIAERDKKAQEDREAMWQERFQAMQAQLDARDETVAGANQLPPAQPTKQDRINEMIAESLYRNLEKDLQTRLGIDLNKPTGNEKPSDMDNAQRFIQGLSDAAGKVMRSIGEMRGMQQRTKIDEQQEPSFQPLQTAATPPQLHYTPLTQETPFLQYVRQQQLAQPVPEQAPPPEQPKIPPGDVQYYDEQGNELDPTTVQHLLESKQAEIRKVENE